MKRWVKALNPKNKEEKLDLLRRIDKYCRFNEENKCLEWIGARNTEGYGYIHYNHFQWRVHRLAWTILKGEIPYLKVICHKCDNPRCFNIDHLFLGTKAENNKDRARKGRNRDQHGSNNHMAKLNDTEREMVRVLVDSGFGQSEVAEVFGMTQSGIGIVYRSKNKKN